MKNIELLEEKVISKVRKADIDAIVKISISMYGGVGEKIEVLCDNALLDNVIEVFGKDIKITKYDANHFKLTMNKDLEGFKYYLLRNIEFIKIIKPQKLKEEIAKILKSYLAK